LWRELWDAHEGWGGYPGAHDALTYRQLGARLDETARSRCGHPALGRHIHVGATLVGVLAGLVVGWVERQGVDPETPQTCEVRSLIVASWARGVGVGRALLEGLSDIASTLARGAPVVFGAEVLEPNPARTFYERLGYAPIAWSLRSATDPLTRLSGASKVRGGGGLAARVAEPRDALAICLLDAVLAERRRAQGDHRYDRPRSIDAATVGAVAAHLGSEGGAIEEDGGRTVQLVASDAGGRVCGAATLALSMLDPPFLRIRRAVLGRLVADPARDAEPVLAQLIVLSRRLAARADATSLELTELGPPTTPTYRAGVVCGGVPWSRVFTKLALPGRQA
jgi:GNAT superfamily N-acetyltransferase